MSGHICKNTKLQKDRGYAWVILLMSLLSHSLHLGFSFAVLGNLTVAHRIHFGVDLQISSWIGTLHTGILFLFGKTFELIMIVFANLDHIEKCNIPVRIKVD